MTDQSAATEQSTSIRTSVAPSAILPDQRESTPPPDAEFNRSSTTVVPAEADDTIVVVAQRTKRKRLDSGTLSANGAGTPGESEVRKKRRKEEKGKAKVPTPEIQIFDYTTAPNILDDLPVEEVDAVQTARAAGKGKGKGKGEGKRRKQKGQP